MSQLSSDRLLGNFKDLQKAVFTGGPNRFTVECLINNRKERAYLPNPGRLWELLLPGKELYLTRNPQVSEGSTKYTVVAVEKEGIPVLLHTHHANTVRAISDWSISEFGVSDCFCETHLFGMCSNPIFSPAFIEMLQHFRIGYPRYHSV